MIKPKKSRILIGINEPYEFDGMTITAEPLPRNVNTSKICNSCAIFRVYGEHCNPGTTMFACAAHHRPDRTSVRFVQLKNSKQ